MKALAVFVLTLLAVTTNTLEDPTNTTMPNISENSSAVAVTTNTLANPTNKTKAENSGHSSAVGEPVLVTILSCVACMLIIGDRLQ
ncbi:hypothetical protein KP79_PYT21808 [Mizuhopecten yessoensis]|uniref:Uncharacterized protein n=1 Tax=Mizuhopecten yessoensis TaxID=6573 RepID=A0A210Q3X8_MIZYE|nr:hypothetical protein KP79_PYT21808 [Mizuhopecten yessoensis]